MQQTSFLHLRTGDGGRRGLRRRGLLPGRGVAESCKRRPGSKGGLWELIQLLLVALSGFLKLLRGALEAIRSQVLPSESYASPDLSHSCAVVRIKGVVWRNIPQHRLQGGQPCLSRVNAWAPKFSGNFGTQALKVPASGSRLSGSSISIPMARLQGPSDPRGPSNEKSRSDRPVGCMRIITMRGVAALLSPFFPGSFFPKFWRKKFESYSTPQNVVGGENVLS